jgi:hypothetical protein
MYTVYVSVYESLCTGGAYYVTYIFRFISNKFWNWGGGAPLPLPPIPELINQAI